MTEDDSNYLTAAAINLYHESIRRDGRGILAPQDVPVLYELIEVITHPVQVAIVPRESRPLSETERDTILQGVRDAGFEPTGELNTEPGGVTSVHPLPHSLRRLSTA